MRNTNKVAIHDHMLCNFKEDTMKRTALLAFTALIMAFTMPALADIYRWVDANGKVKYGDKPPVGAKYEIIRNKKVVGVKNPNKAPLPTKANAAGQPVATAAPKKLSKAELCQQNIAQLNGLYRNRQSFAKDDAGKQRQLSDAEIATQIKKLTEATKGC